MRVALLLLSLSGAAGFQLLSPSAPQHLGLSRSSLGRSTPQPFGRLALAQGRCLPSLRIAKDRGPRMSLNSKPSFVILPGFGNAMQDYINPLGTGEEKSISFALQSRGYEVKVMPLERIQWLNILRQIFLLSFWTSTATPYEPGYGWYIEMAKKTIAEAAAAAEGRPLVLIGHSAGGWLGRAVLGDGEWEVEGSGLKAKEVIQGLVTLGAPHFPPPEDDPSLMDMTRGALTWTDRELPGTYLSDEGIRYITVGSGLIPGEGSEERGTLGRAAYESYRIVCGNGDTLGDGVVPLISTHLEGAEQITMPCYHSIEPPSNTVSERGSWYGSDSQVDTWLKCLEVSEQNNAGGEWFQPVLDQFNRFGK